MNLCEAFLEGRRINKAIKRKIWEDADIYLYHGMDNLLYEHSLNKDTVQALCVSDILANDWVLADAPYHGTLC